MEQDRSEKCKKFAEEVKILCEKKNLVLWTPMPGFLLDKRISGDFFKIACTGKLYVEILCRNNVTRGITFDIDGSAYLASMVLYSMLT